MATRSWLGAGALLSSGGVLATWACCSLPLAAGALGVGIGTLGTVLTPWRPYLIVFSLLLAAISLAAAYRPLPLPTGSPVCARPSMSRRRRRLWSWFLLVATVVIATLPLWQTLWLAAV